jgi:hypothetical protein
MRIRPKIGDDCFNAANAASGNILSREEIEAAFQHVFDEKRRLASRGDIDNAAERLRSFAEKEAERTRIAAAMQRRHAALNILARDRLDKQLQGFLDAGMKPQESMLAILEGTPRAVENGRSSVDALKLAYEARYVGGVMSEIQRDMPHLIHALRDPVLDADIAREMAELRDGGKPGITGNKDAQYAAKVFAKYAELSRTDLNRLGGSIGKLDGWAGAQTHDNLKMIEAGKDAWISAILPKLDLLRTFPDATTEKDIIDALDGIYDTLVTGFPNKPTPKEMGQRVNPANLAKSLGKSRVLHFKDADAALAYRNEFGYGNTVSGMLDHLRRSAGVASAMDALGPNPEVMFGSIAKAMERKIKEGNLPDKEKATQIRSLEADKLRQALDIATGLISRPSSVTGAKIAADIRATESMAKLGGAVLTALPSDTVQVAISSMFRGSGFMHGLVSQIDGIMHGRPKGEQAEISYLLGEGFDGIIGHIVNGAAAVDGPVGKMAKIQEMFFKYSGLTWATDVGRSVAGRTISAEMGLRAAQTFEQLPKLYRDVLVRYGIDGARWEAIRQADGRMSNGHNYITPDAIRALPDEVVANIGKGGDDARRELEMSLLKFVADQTNYGVIETGARSRRTSTLGLRPGTVAGETVRFIMQFKGFPIAFMQRVYGHVAYGYAKDVSLATRSAHIGTLIAATTMAGYMSMAMKDLIKGYWPPRDPTDPKTWAAAFVQGGAAGIYGDYLFSQVNRFGSGPMETAAGPTLGTAGDAIELALKARDYGLAKVQGKDARGPAADLVNLLQQNTPFVNLLYVKPALDYLFMDSLREAIKPGYMMKQSSRRKSDYGQTKLPALAQPMRPFN